MEQSISPCAFSRRRFLTATALLPALGRMRANPAFAAEPAVRPAYLDLVKDILPGEDEFPAEKAAVEIAEALEKAMASGYLPADASAASTPVFPSRYQSVAPDIQKAVMEPANSIAEGWTRWRESLGVIRRAQFYPLTDGIVRYEVASEQDGRLVYRVGHWKQSWAGGRLLELATLDEHVTSAARPFFRDVTASVLASCHSFNSQLAKGIPYWRSRLDPATGIDVYGSNGIAVGDIDNDGIDEIYVCQPGGLPNRLYKMSADGRATDITKQWDCGLLDDTSSALLVDLRNSGRQDLVVLRSSGPVLYLNEGAGFELRTDAFRFASAPAGAFTGMAAADFDRDGKLDLYFCCYVYFQSEAQYTYASPYHDARNGPPNFLFRNRLTSDGGGFFEDCTQETGMGENNDRFSFAPSWCDFNSDGWPDLYVANDFGRKNLYVNEQGHFHDRAAQAGVEDIGPGMSASWFDADLDGKPDLYVANMWTAAGQRLIKDPKFTPAADESRKDAYRRHTKGNSLYRNRGDGTFEDVSIEQHAEFGRWAWSSGGHDLDNDGNAELLVTCGMLTNQSTTDLESFFWRQVVGHAPVTARASAEYENGWNALNQFIREDYSWSGRQPNVLHAKRGERYYDFSGVSGLDFAEDSRAFAVTDFDGDGRPDVILKSRLGPQVRFLQNDCTGSNRSIGVVLEGTKSNRDAIGARVEVDGRTKWLEAGSGFLSQHSKRMIFGLGDADRVKNVKVTWPSGATQVFQDLAPGHTHWIVEGKTVLEARPFAVRRELETLAVPVNNQLGLRDTWLLEPVPLPEKPASGVRLVVLADGQRIAPAQGIPAQVIDFTNQPDKRRQYEVFRRYLFDWRTALSTPLAFLLNDDGHAVKVYAETPSEQQLRADLAQPATALMRLALPFEGSYVKQPRRDFFKFGAAFLGSGYPEQALPYLEQSLKHDPANARVLVLVGQIHLQAERLNAAEKAFRAALGTNPNNAEAWSGLAELFDSRGDLVQALASYDKSLAIKPDSVRTLLNAGRAADKSDRQPQAEAWYRKAWELSPRSPEAANGLGLALAKQGHAEEARKYFEQSIALRKDYAAAINNLGVLYLQQGNSDDAIAAFNYGIQMAPDEDILYLNLGRTYTRKGNNDKAREVMQKLLDRKPANTTALRALQELGSK